MLTGKAKIDFNKWIEKEQFNKVDLVSDIEGLPAKLNGVLLPALILEFLDTVGFVIEITRYSDKCWQWFVDDGNECPSSVDEENGTRQKATIEAVETANKLYNQQPK